MQIDKQQIIDLLKNRGEHNKASQAQSELPDKVDHEQDSGQLSRFGIKPTDLMGGAAGKLGL